MSIIVDLFSAKIAGCTFISAICDLNSQFLKIWPFLKCAGHENTHSTGRFIYEVLGNF